MMKHARFFTLFMIVAAHMAASVDAFAQSDAEELAKKLANPIASLISVPFQNNTDFGIGSSEGVRNTMNFQPVLPIRLNENLNLISRVIIPVISQYNVRGPGETESGISDAVLSGFFSPANSKNGITWGAGPVFLLPIGGEDFTLDQFGVGPTAVGLRQTNGWTYGGLINQIWTLGDEDENISQMFFQPFLTYNWKSGAGLGVNMELTQNWTFDQTTVWLNPIATAVTSLGKQKVQFGAGPRLNLAAPDGGKADWGVRTVIVLLFPA